MKQSAALAVLGAALILTPIPALAYIGPGSGISAFGAALALIAAVFFAIVGFVWYPVKRLMRKKKASAAPEVDTTPNDQE